MKETLKKQNIKDAQKKDGPVVKSMESFLRPEESLWWKRFVEKVGFELGVLELGV